MSTPYTFEPESSHSPPVKPRHPLGLPPGSVRTVMTFMVVGTIWGLMLMPREKNIQIPLYLYYLLFLMMGSYFTTRTSVPREYQESPPLGLPRWLISFVVIAGFLGVMGYGFYKDKMDFFKGLAVQTASDDALVTQALLPLVLIGAFFLGKIISGTAHLVLAGPRGMPAWYADIQAWLSLLAVIGLTVEVVILLIVNPNADKKIDLPHWQGGLCAVIAFYFGARS